MPLAIHLVAFVTVLISGILEGYTLATQEDQSARLILTALFTVLWAGIYLSFLAGAMHGAQSSHFNSCRMIAILLGVGFVGVQAYMLHHTTLIIYRILLGVQLAVVPISQALFYVSGHHFMLDHQ